jgi:hypothetical protein
MMAPNYFQGEEMSGIKVLISALIDQSISKQEKEKLNEIKLHIDAQERRIAELEKQISAQAGQEPIGYFIGSVWITHVRKHTDGAYALYAAPPAPAPANAIDADIEEIMTQIQEFASSWSLVGGRFDDGSMLEVADDSKANIRKLILAIMKAAK